MLWYLLKRFYLIKFKAIYMLEFNIRLIFKVFDRLRTEYPDFTNKIKILDGDLQYPLLNLSPNDFEWILDNVNFIFHCAATLKFDEHISKATQINVEGTERLLNIATQTKNLKVNTIK